MKKEKFDCKILKPIPFRRQGIWKK